MKKMAAVLLALAFAGCSSEPKKTNEPAGAGGPSTTPASNVDMRDYLQAVLPAPWPKDAAGLKVGDWVEMKSQSGANKPTVMHIAIVGEAGDKLLIELSGDAYQGYLEGLTCQKADGKIVEAVAAKKGEKGRPIKISSATAAAPTATTAEESVTVPAGTFKSRKTTISGQLSDTMTWMGLDGDAKGVELKTAQDETTLRELKSLGMADVPVNGKPSSTLHAAYSEGSEVWYLRGARVPFYGADDMIRVKETRAGTTTEFSWGEGAKPEIDWAK